MAFKLRPYQQRLVDVAIGHLHDYPESQPIIVAPTASGKSVIVAELCVELSKLASGMVLVLTHRRELVAQNAAKLPEHLDVGVYSAGLGKKQLRRVTVAGFQSIRNKVDKLPSVSFILIDECFSAETLVDTEIGKLSIKTLSEMPDLPLIYCFNESSGEVVLDRPLRVWQSGTKQVALLTHSEGGLKCTPTHKFYSNDSWVEAEQLVSGQRLYVLDESSGFLKRLLRASAAVAKKFFRAI